MQVETIPLSDWAHVYDNAIVCAHCKGENTHLRSVETFSRAEDASTGTHVVADIYQGSVIVDADLSLNPSSRRDAVIVYFECEYCDKLTELRIIQHKGNDYIVIHPSQIE